MIKYKKGLSEVIVTLITVLLAIVAIGIIWVVVSEVLNSNAQSIDIAEKCQGVSIQIEKVTWENLSGIGDVDFEDSSFNECLVYLKRLPGIDSEEISGIEAYGDSVLLNEYIEVSGTAILDKNKLAGNFLDTKIIRLQCEKRPSTLSIKAYFEDSETEEKQYCSAVSTTNIVLK